MKTFKTLTTLALLTLISTNLNAGRVKFGKDGKAIISGKHNNIKGCRKDKPCEEDIITLDDLMKLKTSKVKSNPKLKQGLVCDDYTNDNECSERGLK